MGPSLGCTAGPAKQPSPPPPPALPLSWHSRHGAGPGDVFQGYQALPGAHHCSRLLSPSSAVCMLCRQAQVDPDICGQTFVNGGLCAHHFCLFFANNLLKRRRPVGGISGFPLDAVQRTIQQADKKVRT
ncbi:PHD finger protein 7-like isoform X1 [Coturnix japonica]|uniref:PHD finger protein 7-like isoform X1 n=1 Tax=Coturnix japonica TaxID=93934 RepID=UPI0007776440|nr:PHD finger protein 7-like isoform X1 [Coturnix japonica]